MTKVKSTTVLAIEHNGEVVIGADGQATMGNYVAKSNVNKVRSLQEGKIITGFAGSTEKGMPHTEISSRTFFRLFSISSIIDLKDMLYLR